MTATPVLALPTRGTAAVNSAPIEYQLRRLARALLKDASSAYQVAYFASPSRRIGDYLIIARPDEASGRLNLASVEYRPDPKRTKGSAAGWEVLFPVTPDLGYGSAVTVDSPSTGRPPEDVPEVLEALRLATSSGIRSSDDRRSLANYGLGFVRGLESDLRRIALAPQDG